MKKYIDLDEALELFDADMNFYNWNGEVRGKLAHISAFQKVTREKLLSLPLADVVEVKRGIWFPRNSGLQKWFRCSECAYKLYELKGTKFCPNCGADMREEKQDG